MKKIIITVLEWMITMILMKIKMSYGGLMFDCLKIVIFPLIFVRIGY